MGNKNVHIIVKENTKKELNDVRALLEKGSANRISHDEVITLLLQNFTTKSKKAKNRIGEDN